MDFSAIVSTKPQPGWYSPAADRHGVAAADLHVAREVASSKDLNLGILSKLYLGAVMKADHCILVQPEGQAQWFFPLAHLPGSAALLWPAVQGLSPGGEKDFWVPSSDVKEATLLPVSDLSKWSGFSYSWRGPMWQYVELPSSRGKWPNQAIRAFRTTPTYGLQELAARCAFWTLPKSWLDTLAADVGADVPSGSGLFGVVWALCT